MRPRLIAITDLTRASEAAHVAAYAALADLLPPAAFAIQIRVRDRPAGDVVRFVSSLRAGVPRARLVLNDRLDLARALGVDAVHLGEGSVSARDARALLGDGVWISRAVHAADAPLAEVDGALLSPIFASPGKGTPLGPAALARFVQTHDVPVYALGGVAAGNVGACLSAGAWGVAAIRACLETGQHRALARALLEA